MAETRRRINHGVQKGVDPRNSPEAMARLDRISGKTPLDKSSSLDLLKDLKWLRGRRNNAAYEIRQKLNGLKHIDDSIALIERTLKGRGYHNP